jgi:hypothetical protein
MVNKVTLTDRNTLFLRQTRRTWGHVEAGTQKLAEDKSTGLPRSHALAAAIGLPSSAPTGTISENFHDLVHCRA